MPDRSYPLVVRTMLGFKADLLAGEVTQIEDMTRSWLRIEERLQSSFDALAREIDALRAKGETIKPWKLARMDRYKSLINQVVDQLDFYGGYAANKISREQENMIMLGIRHAVEAIRSYFTTFGRVPAGFD